MCVDNRVERLVVLLGGAAQGVGCESQARLVEGLGAGRLLRQVHRLAPLLGQLGQLGHLALRSALDIGDHRLDCRRVGGALFEDMLIKLRRDRAFFDLGPQRGHVVAPACQHLHLALDVGDHLIDRRGLLRRLERLEDVDLALHVLLDPVIEALVGLFDGLDRFLLRLGARLGRLRQICLIFLEIFVCFGQSLGGLGLLFLRLRDAVGFVRSIFLLIAEQSVLLSQVFQRRLGLVDVLLGSFHARVSVFLGGGRLVEGDLGRQDLAVVIAVAAGLIVERLLVFLLGSGQLLRGRLDRGVRFGLGHHGISQRVVAVLLGREDRFLQDQGFCVVEHRDQLLVGQVDRTGRLVKVLAQPGHDLGERVHSVPGLVDLVLVEGAALHCDPVELQQDGLISLKVRDLGFPLRHVLVSGSQELPDMFVGVLDVLDKCLELRFLGRQGVRDAADHARGGLHKTAQRALDIGIEPDAQAFQRGVEPLHVALQVVGHRDPHILSGSGAVVKLLCIIGKSGFAVLRLTGEAGHDHLQVSVVALPGDRLGHAGLLLLRQGRPDPGHPAEDIRQTRHVALGVVDRYAVLLQGGRAALGIGGEPCHDRVERGAGFSALDTGVGHDHQDRRGVLHADAHGRAGRGHVFVGLAQLVHICVGVRHGVGHDVDHPAAVRCGQAERGQVIGDDVAGPREVHLPGCRQVDDPVDAVHRADVPAGQGHVTESVADLSRGELCARTELLGLFCDQVHVGRRRAGERLHLRHGRLEVTADLDHILGGLDGLPAQLLQRLGRQADGGDFKRCFPAGIELVDLAAGVLRLVPGLLDLVTHPVDGPCASIRGRGGLIHVLLVFRELFVALAQLPVGRVDLGSPLSDAGRRCRGIGGLLGHRLLQALDLFGLLFVGVGARVPGLFHFLLGFPGRVQLGAQLLEPVRLLAVSLVGLIQAGPGSGHPGFEAVLLPGQGLMFGGQGLQCVGLAVEGLADRFHFTFQCGRGLLGTGQRAFKFLLTVEREDQTDLTWHAYQPPLMSVCGKRAPRRAPCAVNINRRTSRRCRCPSLFSCR